MAAAIARIDSTVDLNAFGTTVEGYWQHCVGSVATAEELNARGIVRYGSGFSTAAPLHDFGKLILADLHYSGALREAG